MKRILPAISLCLAAFTTAGAVDYKNDVLPIMKEHCWKCHSNEEDVKGNLALDAVEEAIGRYNIIRPGDPKESSFLEKMLLDKGHSDFMPRKGEPLPKAQLAIIEEWITKGAVVDAKNPTDKEKEFLATGTAAAMEDEKSKFHTWTNSEGRTIEARFVRVVNGAVTIVMKDGRSFNVPMDKLSADSRALAEKLAAK